MQRSKKQRVCGRSLICRAASIAALGLLYPAGVSRADNYNWINQDGQFSMASNWTDESTDPPSMSVPGDGDDVNYGAGMVMFDGDATHTATINGTVTFDLSGGNYTVSDFTNATGSLSLIGAGTFTAGTFFLGAAGGGNLSVAGGSSLACLQMVVGYSGIGSLDISSGTLTSTTQTNIFGDGQAGMATIDSGGVWNSAYNMDIGFENNSTLTIQNGGILKSDQSTSFNSYIAMHASGDVVVTGKGSTWTDGAAIGVGFANVGTLNITAGGVVTSKSGLVSYAFDSGGNTVSDGGTGNVLIDGMGSTWNAPQGFFIGASGAGSVDLTNGGSLNASTGNINVGYATGGMGTLDIESGSTAAGATCSVGNQTGSAGTLTVNGSGSKLTLSASLQVGEQGAGTATISGQGNVSVSSTCVIGDQMGSTGTLTVQDMGSQLTLSSYLQVGEQGAGTMTIESGTNVTAGSFAVVGDQKSATGMLTVKGTGSQLAFSSFLDIASAGAGTLVASGGASLSVSSFCNMGDQKGANAYMKITDSGTSAQFSSFFTAGIAGNAEVDVLNGASVSFATGFTLAQSATGAGTLTVDGTSTVDSSMAAAYVGGAGSGSLNITGGGVLSASDLFVASQANATAMSSVIVDGAGSQLNIAGDVNLGQKGNATGSIRDSGSFSCNTAEVGSGTTGFGYITVQDSGQWSIASDLTIGQSGDGNVTLQGGGTIMVGGNLDIAQKPGSLGNLTVDGGMSDLDFNMGTVTIGDAGTGSMTLQNGAVVDLGISQGVTVGSQATGVGTLVVTASPGGMPSAGGAGTPAEIDITSLIVGASGKGTVLVNSGATMVIYGDLTLGQNANSAGTLTVDGGATDLNLTGEDATSNVAIGESGAGTMTIQNGADVDLTNTNPVDVGQQSTAKGTLTVTGTDTNLDTSDLTIGEAGSGTLMVNSTANLATFGNVALGVEQNANGTATVTGGQTQWSLSGFTTVGEGGNGTLNITAGGVVDATLADSVFPLIVGDDTTGAGTIMISDANSMLTSAGDVIVGEYGAGTVSIVDNGAMVVTGNLNIGSLSTGNGLVTVGAMGIGGGDLQAASTGSLSVGNGLSVGTVGKGDLELDGGTVTLNAKGSGSLVIGDAGTGTIAIYEGTLNAAGASSILLGNQTTGNGTLIIDGPDSSFNFGSVPITVGVHGTGTLKVTDGGQFTIGSLALGAQQGSTGNLIVDGSGASGVTTLVSASQLIVGGSDADIMSQSGGTGSVTVQNGGQLTSVDAFISQSTGSSQSAVKVTDANSSWTINDNLSIGVSDSGTLTVANGGSVSVRNALTVGTAPALSALNLQGAPGNSGTSQTTMSYGSGISIGNNGAGMVSITGGAILNDLSTTATDYIGQNSGAGTVTVQGGGSTWTTGMLEMNGNGTLASSLNILSGGAVNSKAGVNIQTSNGTILVDGKGNGTPSSWTIGINQGDANYLWAPMTISNGASVSCLGAIYLGDPIPNGPGGTISIQTGGQLSLTSSSFLDLKVDNVVVDAGTLSCPGGVDFAGQSPVTVSNGGVIATGTEGGYAAIDCPLTVQNGGSLNVQTAAVLGDNGYSGSLEIASGGTAMIANNLVVGSAVRGFLQVDGGGSLTVGGVLAISGPITIQSFVMNDRTASVTANGFTIGAYNGPGNNVPQSVSFGGGSITVTGTTQVGDGTSASSLTLTSSAAQLSTGNLVVSTNSSVLLQGGATITASSLTTQQSGTLDVRGGAMTVGTGPQGALGTVTIFKGAVANLAGYLLGTKVIVGGTLAPGNSDPPTIDANLEIDSGGVLDMVINSDTGNTSHLTVTGTTTVAGKVLLDFQHGFAPKAGDSFDLFTVSGGMSALGTDIEVAGLASGWQYSVQDQSGDTYVDSMSDGVATSPEPPSAVGLILLGCASLRRPRRA